MNQVKLFHLNAACTVLTFYFIAYTFILSNSVMGYVQNKAMVDSHHVIFDNLGKMSTGITYINVAIPLNISIFSTQIGLFDSFLTNLITAYTNTTNNSSSKLDIINAQNMVTLTKAITHYARQRLYTLQHQLQSIDNLLPQDESFEKSNVRHKRFLEVLFPVLMDYEFCARAKNRTKHLQQNYTKISMELEHYKTEYAKLYHDTMPEVVPDYLDENFEFQNSPTVLQEAKDLERQTRDVQFLLNILALKTNSTRPTTTTTPKPSTTPSPFKDFETLFGKRNKSKQRGSNSFYMAPDSKYTTTQLPKIKTPPREKRFVAAAALVTGILGTFMGLYNTIEINRIQNDLKDLQQGQKLLIEFTKTMEHQIIHTQMALSNLENIFSLFIKNNPALLYAKFNDQLMTIQDRIYDLKDTVQMLQLQKLSTSLLTFTQLHTLYAEIQALASTNKLSLLTNKPQDLFQLDTSYIRVKNDVLILLHVPCASPDNLLTIYKYVPFPIPVYPASNGTDDKNTIKNLFDSQGPFNSASEGITFQPEADLIAIGKNSYNKNRFILLSSAELQACTKKSTAFICERHQVTRSDLLSSCLGSLFLQSSNGVLNNCKIDRIKLREKVYQISNTQHIVYTPQPLTTQITCYNGSYFPLKIKNTKFITIPEGCTVELTNHSITSDYTIRTTSQSIYFEWDFDPTTLPNSADMLSDSKTIDIKIEKLKNLIQLIKDDEIDDKEFDALMTRHYSSGSWFPTLMLAILIFSVLIGICSIGICGKNYLARARTVVEDHVVYQRHNHPESDDDDDEISRIVRGTGQHRAPSTRPSSRANH